MTTWMDDLAASVASVAERGGSGRGAAGRLARCERRRHRSWAGCLPMPTTCTAARSRRGSRMAGPRRRRWPASIPMATSPSWTPGPVTPPPFPGPTASPVTIGMPVFAVTGTDGGPRVTFGLVSAVARPFRGPRGRRIAGSIEHTAPMARGSSGSALVDATGHLVGLNTNRLEGGLYLALPTDAALRARVRRARRGRGRPSRPDWVSASRQPGLPGGCAARSVCRSVTGCSSVMSMRMATRHAPASRWATSSWRRVARRYPTPTSWRTRSLRQVARWSSPSSGGSRSARSRSS